MSIFSGLAVAGLVDRMVIRDNQSLPYVPGSSVKGRWRFFAERWLRSLLAAQVHPPGLSLHQESDPLCKDWGHACTVCRVFGNSSIASRLWVGSARLDDALKHLFRDVLDRNKNPVIHPDTELRPGIALSRMRRTALEDHLFFDEVLPRTVAFTGTVLIKQFKDFRPEEERFLVETAKMVDRLGARKSLGRGELEGGIAIDLPGGVS
jgi:CRISPR/Cas system CSM-associated protein Csm3 (group 7 of RAMP superfamily)